MRVDHRSPADSDDFTAEGLVVLYKLSYGTSYDPILSTSRHNRFSSDCFLVFIVYEYWILNNEGICPPTIEREPELRRKIEENLQQAKDTGRLWNKLIGKSKKVQLNTT